MRQAAGIHWRHDLVAAGYGSLREVECEMSMEDVLGALDALSGAADIERIVAEFYRDKE